MDCDKKEKIYCDDDGDCHICDEIAIERYCNNHLKSQTHINKFRKRQQFNSTNDSTSFSTTNNALDFELVVSFNWGLKKPSCYFEISHVYPFIYNFIRPKFE